MIISKELIESVLPNGLKQPLDENSTGKWKLLRLMTFQIINFTFWKESLNAVAECLRQNIEQIRNEISKVANANFRKIQPEIEKSETLMQKIDSLQSQLKSIKKELVENVIRLIIGNCFEFDNSKSFSSPRLIFSSGEYRLQWLVSRDEVTNHTSSCI